MRAEEFDQLPFKYCLFGHGGVEDVTLANCTMTPALIAALDKVRAAARLERGAGFSDPKALPTLLAAVDEAKAAFAVAPRATAGEMPSVPPCKLTPQQVDAPQDTITAFRRRIAHAG